VSRAACGRRPRGLRLVATSALVAVVGCRASAPQPPPNVVLIVADALRADHLGAYGYDRPTSPAFDAAAARGVLFTRVWSTTSWTNPAVESLFTGEFPRVLQPGAATFIAPHARTLAMAFHERGYRTAAIVASPVIPPDLGFGQGFDDYVGVSGWVRGWSQRPKEPGERVNAAARKWLAPSATRGAPPWFLYLHYMDTHSPYEPPIDTAQRFWRSDGSALPAAYSELNKKIYQRPPNLSPDETRQSADLYDAAVAHLDFQIADLLRTLDAAGQLSHTVICIVADHGEELGDHGGFLHARTLYQEVLHIPLLIIRPGKAPAQRIERPVQITDVGRTLLDAAGLHDSAFPGHSLLDESTPAVAAAPLFAELMLAPFTDTLHQYALVRDHHKLIITATGQQLLFDLERDPGEQHSEAGDHPGLVAQLAQTVTQLATPHQPQPVAQPDAATRERLRELGYTF